MERARKGSPLDEKRTNCDTAVLWTRREPTATR